MNRKLAKMVNATEFFIGKTPNLLRAISFIQNQGRKWRSHMSCDVERILRIRDEVARWYTAKYLIEVTRKNSKVPAGDLLLKAIDKLVANRSVMCGCCHDCMTNVYDSGNYDYMLHTKVWKKAAKKDQDKFLCIKCVENRLGRSLKNSDFDWDIPLNFIDGDRCMLLELRMGVEL